ncbi:MAG: hypothetical protein IJ273_00985 [Alphaproteobacteria bacterium]|nr:hypothetical protein [Alphaproteobacteria bacterium]MBQ8729268.1 hypothetical protein [Alphaproteobacteria bacterium]
MKVLPKFLFKCSMLIMVPAAASAAGTYYTGNYQSPQTRYTQQAYTQRTKSTTYSQQGISQYNRDQYANAGYSDARYSQNQNVRMGQYNQATKRQARADVPAQSTGREGFYLGAGISRQTAMWQFEMKESDSILHYDNIDWNVLDVNAGYNFKAGNTPMQINAGFKYGMQAGESTMVDDDITNGGYFVTAWGTDDDNDGDIDTFLGDQMGHALSIGTSTDGKMMEFNAGFGLTDFFKLGKVKITPSVGWRYLKYELETTKNHGLAVDTFSGSGGCIQVPGSDEIQCDPILIFIDAAGNTQEIAVRGDTNADGVIDSNDSIQIPSGYDTVNAGGTYYWDQPGVSHSYEVEWSGPYFALDMLYDINQNNYVSAHVELGLPSYNATGDQPYRFDWAHPKSVEDEAGVGSAFHLGLGANWATAISDSVMLSVGVTYDYYTVADADAKTYLSEEYYTGIYYDRLDNLYGGDEEEMLAKDKIAQNIVELAEECPGWVCTSDGEIESFYKSLGVRIGINAKF